MGPPPAGNGIFEGNPACGDCCGKGDCGCKPRFCRPSSTGSERLEACCDANGCCCYYPAGCRNPFWPEFTHPRWLNCVDLYDGKSVGCYDGCKKECEDCCRSE